MSEKEKDEKLCIRYQCIMCGNGWTEIYVSKGMVAVNDNENHYFGRLFELTEVWPQ